MRKVFILGVVIASSAMGWLYVQQASRGQPIVSGFIEADQVRVGSRVGGRVSVVHVDEGRLVSIGDPLFDIDPFDLAERQAEAQALLASAEADHRRLSAGWRVEEVSQTRARRDQAAANLSKLLAGPRSGEINIARQTVRMAEADLELAESEYQRVEKLRAEASAAKTEFDRAVRALKRARAEVSARREELELLEEGTRIEEITVAEATLSEATAALRLAESGYRVEEIARAQAQVAAASARVQAIERQLEELTVVSPCDCLVEAIELRPGDLVAPGAPSVALLEIQNLWVRSYVPQSFLGLVHLGDDLPLTVDTLPGETFEGRVVFIASDGEFTPRNLQTPDERGKQVFRMKLEVRGELERLRVGMSADVLLPRRSGP